MDAGAAPDGLDGLLSEARFAPYLARYNGDRKLALRLYTWNGCAIVGTMIPTRSVRFRKRLRAISLGT